jgi:hypothetical protein
MRISSNSFRRHTWRRDVPEGYGGCRLTGLSVASALLLAGCSLGPAITENSADYNTTIEDVTNAALVSNVLRARDHAPLYFSDLAQIRGLLQLNVQPAQTIIPYAHFLGSTTPSSVQAGPLNVNSQPGFDYAPLNTKIFAEGMLTGIDEKVFAYFIQRFIRQPPFLNLFLNLVISRVEVYRQIGVDKADPKYRRIQTWSRELLPGLIARWTTPLRPPTIGLLSKDTPIGPAIPAEILAKQRGALGDLVKVGDDEDLDLSPTKSKQFYQLSKTEQKFVLCVATRPNSVDAVGITSFGVTKDPDETPIAGNNGSCGHGPINPERYVLYTRSVEAIFFYLGELLNERERESQQPPIGFYISDHPVENIRFHMNYRGQTYYVREASPADQTMPVLAFLNALMNLNRDATEIPSTKTVATGP